MKVLSVVALLATSSMAWGSIIWDNGAPDTNQADARSITIFRSADNFVLSGTANISDIRFWMLSVDGDFAGTISYAFHQNAAGSLGSLVASGSVSGIVPTFLKQVPAFIYSYYQVDFNLAVPLTLGPGTYWLELHDGATLTTANSGQVYWGISSLTGGNAMQSSTPNLPAPGSTVNELGFQLFDNAAAVPEPASWLMAATGLGLLAVARKRRR